MSVYKPRLDEDPDKIITGLPVIKPDLHRVREYIQKSHGDRPDEIWLTIDWYDLVSNPATGDMLYNLCMQVILPQSSALALARALMVNGLFKGTIGEELSKHFSAEITDAAMVLEKKLGVLLDEFKKRDDLEHGRGEETGHTVGGAHGQTKDQGTAGTGGSDEENRSENETGRE